MNISKDGISPKEVKLRAFEITFSLFMTTAITAVVFYLILNILLPDSFFFILRILLAVTIALLLTGYLLLKKILAAYAVDVTKRGVDETLYKTYKKI